MFLIAYFAALRLAKTFYCPCSTVCEWYSCVYGLVYPNRHSATCKFFIDSSSTPPPPPLSTLAHLRGRFSGSSPQTLSRCQRRCEKPWRKSKKRRQRTKRFACIEEIKVMRVKGRLSLQWIPSIFAAFSWSILHRFAHFQITGPLIISGGERCRNHFQNRRYAMFNPDLHLASHGWKNGMSHGKKLNIQAYSSHPSFAFEAAESKKK